MIKPAPGMAFIIEDTQETIDKDSTLAASGFVVSDERLAGVTGVIHAVNPLIDCPHCKDRFERDVKQGDRVIYSRFNAEQIDIHLKDVPAGRLRAVPVESILGTL